MNRAIAYLLVDGDVGPHSVVADILDSHKEKMVARAASLGLLLTAVYADIRHEVEGGRRGLKALLNDVRRGHVSSVVVERFEVFADPHLKMIEAFSCLFERGAKIYVLDENRIIDAENINFILRAMMMARQYEQQLKGLRIKRGLHHATLSGRHIGRKPYEESENNAEIFSNIIEMRDRGLSLRDICKALNSAKVETSTQKTWHPTTIKRMLERAK